MTSHPNSNASFINIWDRLIWRRSPNLTRSSKLAAAPNCWWGPTSNLKLPCLDSSHTNNHLYIISQSIMEMLTYFHRMSLNKNCGCMIFSVAYRYRKSMSIIERMICIYIYIERERERVLGIIYSRFLPCLSKSTWWAIMEDLSIRRRVCTFLISWGQKTCEKHCYVDLS